MSRPLVLRLPDEEGAARSRSGSWCSSRRRASSREFAEESCSRTRSDASASVSVATSSGGGGRLNAALRKLEQSRRWQAAVIIAILLNTVVLAFEANSPEENPTCQFLDTLFLLLFVCELALRLSIYRCSFFYNDDWGWNWFDLSVVTMGVIDQVVETALHKTGEDNVSALVAFFRTLRILRVLRAVRLFREFKELNRLANGLVNSITSVAWIAVMFFSLVLGFSIFITNVVGHEAQDFQDPEQIRHWFGTMPRSMRTLSIFLTCDDWSTPARMVNEEYPWMVFFWTLYMVLGAFLIMSLLTGLMADKMRDARDEAEAAERPSPDELPQLLQRLRAGPLGRGKGLTCAQFAKLLSSSEWREALGGVGLKTETEGQRTWVFQSLDRDNSGFISWDELHVAFESLGSHAQANGSMVEMMKLEGIITRLDRKLGGKPSCAHDADPGWDQRLDLLHARANLMRERVSVLEADLLDFLKSAGYEHAAH